jgi:hypothetical protein
MGRALSVHRTWKRVDRSLPLHLFLPDSTSPHALLMDGNRIFAAESNVLCILQVTRRGRETIFDFFFRSGFTIQMSFLPPLYGPAVTLGYPRACWSGGRCLRYATSAEVVAAVE